MSPKISWSAFIYTKTYKVDYRIIAHPDDFNDDKKKWVTSHIKEVNTAITLKSLSPPEELLQRIFLSDRQHYVFGVLCNLRKLLNENERKDLAAKYLSQADEKAKDLTVDDKDRRVAFAFLGYVIQRTPDCPKLPPIRFDIDIFKPLCEYICHKWLEETQIAPTFLPYKADELSERLLDQNLIDGLLPSLNTDRQKLVLHPGAETYIQHLWTAAALCDKPQTLWIGQLPGNPNPESILVSSVPERSILESHFLNIALPNIESQKIYSKQTPDVGGGEPPDPDGNLLDSISSFLVGEMEKLTGVFSNKSDDYGTKLLALQASVEEFKRKYDKEKEEFERKYDKEKEEFKRKYDKEIADLRSLCSELKEIQNKGENL